MNQTELQRFHRRRHERPGDEFRKLLVNDGLAVAPGCHDGMSAHIAMTMFRERSEQGKPCSFNAVYGSGWSMSAMRLRRPDMGFHDRTEMFLNAKYLVREAYPLPVVMDAEAGLGGMLHIPDVVDAYAMAGVAVAHLEDQPGDNRKCGHLAGRMVVPVKEFTQKLRAWLEHVEYNNYSLLLMARTDSFGAVGGGLSEAIDRGRAYMDVEVEGRRIDLLWCEFNTPDPEPIARWVEAMKAHNPTIPLALNYSPNKDWPAWYRRHRGIDAQQPTYEDFHTLGYSLIFHTILSARAAVEGGIGPVFEDMADHGAAALWRLQDRQRGTPWGDPQALSGAVEWQAWEKHIGGAEAEERYTRSGGYKKEEG